MIYYLLFCGCVFKHHKHASRSAPRRERYLVYELLPGGDVHSRLNKDPRRWPWRGVVLGGLKSVGVQRRGSQVRAFGSMMAPAALDGLQVELTQTICTNNLSSQSRTYSKNSSEYAQTPSSFKRQNMCDHMRVFCGYLHLVSLLSRYTQTK